MLSLLNNNKFCLRSWCTKKPSGYKQCTTFYIYKEKKTNSTKRAKHFMINRLQQKKLPKIIKHLKFKDN